MGKQWKQWETLYFGAPKSLLMVTAAMKFKDACSLEEKLWPSILKSRDITLPAKVHLVKAVVFPVVRYGCESWTVKKTEHRKIDAFELWCWWKLLRVPWTTRRSSQCILKEISPEYLFEGLVLKLKLQYFGHLMQRAYSLEKTLMLGKTEGRRRRDGRGWDNWMASPTWRPWVWASSWSWWWEAWRVAVHGVAKSQTWLSDWTDLLLLLLLICFSCVWLFMIP